MSKQYFSVLMSLYIKEKKEYFEQCMESIFNQTVTPDEIVIVVDGPINDELKESLYNFKNKYSDIINIVNFDINRGLGPALADGVVACKYDLIARMDTDDICRKDRFEKQLKVFSDNPNLDICGCHIKEFDGNIENVISERRVPLSHEDIAKYQKQRSAFNHMTVMYKKQSVIKSGNYEDCPLMEDDMLWCKMLKNGCICQNIDDYLVFARTGMAMIRRRGGFKYFLKYRAGRKKILSIGYISKYDYFKTIFVQLIVSLLPGRFRQFVFLKLLRK